MHLSDALRRAGGLKPDSYLGQVLVARLRGDSTRTMLHTALSDTTGRASPDLTLADGDEVTVFSTTTFRPNRFITIAGAVRTPGQIPFRDGMTIRDAVLLADGLQEGASLNDAEVARLPENRAAGVTAVTQLVVLDSTYLFERRADGRFLGPPGVAGLPAMAPEITLQPYDAVLIKRQPEWQLQQTVVVTGEVKFPGDYSLTNKTQRLSDIIAHAGGLTTSAYPDGIVFVRKHGGVGRIGVDLSAVLRDPRNVDNLALFDGDSIYIPRYAPVVTVRGAVNSQVGVAYVGGANIDYYIRAAGGANVQGDAGHAYVTQGNGKVESQHRHWLLWRSRPDPLPGSTVVVPTKDPNNRRDWVAVATVATSILGPLVTIFAILKR
jgi:protein involved in polysaccharide export with SLBB domain